MVTKEALVHVQPQYLVTFKDSATTGIIDHAMARAILALNICDHEECIMFVSQHYAVTKLEADDAIKIVLRLQNACRQEQRSLDS